MALEIITFGSSSYVQSALNSMSMLAGSSAWTTLARLAGILGILYVILAGVAKAQTGKIEVDWGWLLMFGVLYGVLFVPKTDVVVTDRMTSLCASGSDYVVTDVPFGIAAFGYVTSGIGAGITDLYEQYITVPSDRKYSETGMAFGANLSRVVTETGIPDSEWSVNATNMMSQCVNPLIARGVMPVNELTRSTDIWSDIENKLPANRFVKMADGSVVSCQEMGQKVNAKFGPGGSVNELAALQAGSALFPQCSANDAKTAFLSGAGGIKTSDVMGYTEDAAEATRQSMLIAALQQGLGQTAMEGDSASIAQSVYTAQAEATQRNTYTLMGSMAARTVPVLRAVLEMLIYAIFPIVLIFALTPAWLKVLGHYVLAMMWIQLWPPLYAILNSIMTWYAEREAKSAAMIEAATNDKGLSLETFGSISHASADIVAMTGYMAVSIPIIAYMIIRGGAMAGSMLASSLTQPMAAAASRSGASLTDADMKSGSVSWDTSNVNTSTMNQAQLAPNMSYGAPELQGRNTFGGVTTSGENFDSYAVGNSKADMGNFGVTAKSMMQSSVQTELAESKAAVADASKDYISSLSGSYAQQQELRENFGSEEFRAQTGFDKSDGVRYQEAMDNREQAARDFSKKTGLDIKDSHMLLQTLSAGGSLGASLGGESGPKLAASLGISLQDRRDTSMTASEVLQEAQNFVTSSGYAQNDSLVRDMQEKASSSDAFAYGSGHSGAETGGIQAVEQASDRLSSSFREQQSWEQVESRMDSDSVEISGNVAGHTQQMLREELGAETMQKGLADFNSGVNSPEAQAVVETTRQHASDIAASAAGVNVAGAPGSSSVDAAHARNDAAVPGESSARGFGASGMNNVGQSASDAGLDAVPGEVDQKNEELGGEHTQKTEDTAKKIVTNHDPNPQGNSELSGFSPLPEIHTEGSAGQIGNEALTREAVSTLMDIEAAPVTNPGAGGGAPSSPATSGGGGSEFMSGETPTRQGQAEIGSELKGGRDEVFDKSPFRPDPQQAADSRAAFEEIKAGTKSGGGSVSFEPVDSSQNATNNPHTGSGSMRSAR